MADLRGEVIEVITEMCRPETPDLSNEDKPLLECGLNSLNFASVLMALEDKYDVIIDEKDINRLRTLRLLVAYLEHRAAR